MLFKTEADIHQAAKRGSASVYDQFYFSEHNELDQAVLNLWECMGPEWTKLCLALELNLIKTI